MIQEHVYLVTYDVADQRRWRRVFKLMKGYGEWLQLSVFQCRLSQVQHAELIALLDNIVNHGQDRVLIIDIGPANSVAPRVVALGAMTYDPIEHTAIVV